MQLGSLQSFARLFGKAHPQDAALAEHGQALREILDEDHRHDVERAAGSLGKHAVQGRAVALGHDEAEAPKAAAERNAAPTFCGSVTWSSTSRMPSRVDLVERDRGQGLRFERHTLMHGVGA